MSDGPRTEEFLYRRDGWPYCPGCGEDELYSLHFAETPRGGIPPSLAEYYEHPLRCYACAWEGDVPYPSMAQRGA